jgi:hypothetical protein
MLRKPVVAILIVVVLLLVPSSVSAAPLRQTLPPTLPIEEIPPPLQYVDWSIPQCPVVLPPQEWTDEWPSGWALLDIPEALRVTASWLTWQISEMLRTMLCWFLGIGDWFAMLLSGLINIVIAGLNFFAVVGIYLWLQLRAAIVAAWIAWHQFLNALDFSWVLDWMATAWAYIQLAGAIGAQIVQIVGQVVGTVLGAIGWVGAIVLGGITSVMTAVQGTMVLPVAAGDGVALMGASPAAAPNIPALLLETSPVYEMVRGLIDAFLASPIGWIFNLLIGAAYISFVFWLSRYLSTNN